MDMFPKDLVCDQKTGARIHESVITYDGHY